MRRQSLGDKPNFSNLLKVPEISRLDARWSGPATASLVKGLYLSKKLLAGFESAIRPCALRFRPEADIETTRLEGCDKHIGTQLRLRYRNVTARLRQLYDFPARQEYPRFSMK